MRPLTVAGVLLVVGLLAGLAFFAFGGPSLAGGDLSEQWVSDTARDNERNHHAVGVGPDGQTVVAPVAAVPGEASLTDTSCSLVRLDPKTGGSLWRAGLPAEDCYTHGLTQPAIADLDGDGTLEVVAGTTANDATLVAYDGATGDELFDVPLPSYAGYGRPTVANLTADPGREIAAADINGNVVVVAANGTVLGRAALDSSTYAAPLVDDVDADGDVEIAVGTGGGVAIFGPTADLERRVDVSAKTFAAGDVDEDAATELFATSAGLVAAVDGGDGTTEWNATFDAIPRVHAVRDADGDGEKEVYVGLSGQRVVALSAATGERLWETRVGMTENAMMPAPVLADVSGDGTLEVVAVTNGGTVTVLDPASGSELAAYERDVTVWTEPTVADLDGDGTDEILVRYGDGRVVALAYAS